MATEIERKFLVTGTQWREAPSIRIAQGYLSREKERTVRVRLADGRAWLTVKGISKGASRAEFEYEIPASDGEQLLKLCLSPVIEKLRHVVVHDSVTWEVDEFLGENAGLVVAEVELETEDQRFTPPDWLGQEVTDDARYFNSSLAAHPYCNW